MQPDEAMEFFDIVMSRNPELHCMHCDLTKNTGAFLMAKFSKVARCFDKIVDMAMGQPLL